MSKVLLSFTGIGNNGFQVVVEFRRLPLARLAYLVYNFIFIHN